MNTHPSLRPVRPIALAVVGAVCLASTVALAQSHQGYRHDYSAYCQNIQGQDRHGPYDRTYGQRVCNNQTGQNPYQQNPYGQGPYGQPTQPPSPTEVEVTIASVAFISFDVTPFAGLVQQALGPPEAMLLAPNWVPLTYMALQATRNRAPMPPIGDFRQFESRRDFRSLLYAKLKITLDPSTGGPTGARLVDQIVNPGYTPPFNRNEFPATYVAFWDDVLKDQTPHAGEAGVGSGFVLSPHPESTLAIPPGERVLVSGLIKFRAGSITDQIGLRKAGTPYHVPWVWNELALTSGSAGLQLRGAASLFPTTWWYWNGDVVHRQHEVADASFPMYRGAWINTSKLNLMPVLTSGAPADGPQSPNLLYPGPVTSGPYTAPSPGAWSAPVQVPQ